MFSQMIPVKQFDCYSMLGCMHYTLWCAVFVTQVRFSYTLLMLQHCTCLVCTCEHVRLQAHAARRTRLQAVYNETLLCNYDGYCTGTTSTPTVTQDYIDYRGLYTPLTADQQDVIVEQSVHFQLSAPHQRSQLSVKYSTHKAVVGKHCDELAAVKAQLDAAQHSSDNKDGVIADLKYQLQLEQLQSKMLKLQKLQAKKLQAKSSQSRPQSAAATTAATSAASTASNGSKQRAASPGSTATATGTATGNTAGATKADARLARAQEKMRKQQIELDAYYKAKEKQRAQQTAAQGTLQLRC
jgi:hypothetical protein